MGLTACSNTAFETPQVQGPAALVEQGEQSHLWVLTKQEEHRTVGVGSSSRRGTMHWRDDTYFHFYLQAFDPLTARPVWKQRLLTIGDDQAKGISPSRVVGSAADGRLLGQDGDVVWLLINQSPYAVSAVNGRVLADAASLVQRNPSLDGRLPDESRYYGFDRGLVLMAANAERIVIRGPQLIAEPYRPAPTATAPADLMANGRERIVPIMPMGEVPARLARLEGDWLGLYSEKEAADAANDPFGDKLRFPYSVTNEGSLARRSFWRPRMVSMQRFDEVYDHIEAMEPMAGTPGFLKGRFLKDITTGEARVMSGPTGVVVWHSTRIDRAGRLALTRLDAKLQPLWTRELPMSENSTSTPVRHWPLADRLVVMGTLETDVDGLRVQEPCLASIALADGGMQAWNLAQEAAQP